jgi:hypothetical protein
MSVAVELKRFTLTATIRREGILILFWIGSKLDATFSLGGSF